MPAAKRAAHDVQQFKGSKVQRQKRRSQEAIF
jgi:hypothetical protein